MESKNYLNNKDILAEVIKSKAQDRPTEELGRMFILLTQKLLGKANFSQYSYKDDMQSYALYMLCRTWNKFDETRFNNAFAYYTSCVYNSYIQFIKREAQHSNLRDDLLIAAGFLPSYSRQIDDATQNRLEIDGEVLELQSTQDVSDD